MSEKRISEPVELIGPAKSLHHPTFAWNLSDFTDVDDRVRGGSSQSHVALSSQGELKFYGDLDTTTLGGAGFASQRNTASPPFPITLNSQDYSGLSIHARPLPQAAGGSVPGGGKGPVTVYNLNLYTSMPQRRADGRMESSVVYEADFNITKPTSQQQGPDSLAVFDLPFSSFQPTYRGRPADNASPLDPSQIKLWSLMARSNFSQQSGPFDLQVESIWALPVNHNHQSRRSIRFWDEENFRPANLTGSPGFALYLFATLLFIVWVFWALTPDTMLRRLGIQGYPNREWAFLLPSFSILLVLLAYIVYMGISLIMTPDLQDLSTIVDPKSNPVSLKRAEDMTFEEAVEYYQNEHPYRLDSNQAAKGKDRHVRDMLP
ncbi:unnamed protein product [Sympodiomycopsis kandeliae]